MEVKPGVVEVWILHLIIHAGKLLTNHVLRSLLIDKVDQVLLTVKRFSIFEMVLRRHDRVLKVLVNFDWWCPLKIWLHTPYQRDGSTDLHIACHGHYATFTLIVDEYMFSLDKVRCITFLI